MDSPSSSFSSSSFHRLVAWMALWLLMTLPPTTVTAQPQPQPQQQQLQQQQQEEERQTHYGILHLFPFSNGRDPTQGKFATQDDDEIKRWSRATPPAHLGYSYTAAAVLAQQHFNDRDTAVVPELVNLTRHCPDVQLYTVAVADTEMVDLTAGEAILENGATADGILGPYHELAAEWSRALSATLHLPQLFYSAVDDRITDPGNTWNTLRVTAASKQRSFTILSFLQSMKRKHLAIVYSGHPQDNLRATGMSKEAQFLGIEVERYPMVPEPALTPEEATRRLMSQVHTSGIKTILLMNSNLGPGALKMFSEALDHAGLLSDDYVILLEETMAPPQALPAILHGKVPEGGALERMLDGAFVVTSLDSTTSASSTSSSSSSPLTKFQTAWKDSSESLVGQINQIVPLRMTGSPAKETEQSDTSENNTAVMLSPSKGNMSDGTFGNGVPIIQNEADYFRTTMPLAGSGFVYDAVMAFGLGACRLHSMKPHDIDGAQAHHTDEKNGLPPPQRPPPPSQSAQEGAGRGRKQKRGVRGLQPAGVQKDSQLFESPKNSESGPTKKAFSGPPPHLKGGPSRTLLPHLQAIVETSFTGASGNVQYDQSWKRDRQYQSLQFGVFNIRRTRVTGEDEATAGSSSFETVLVQRTQNDIEDNLNDGNGVWKMVSEPVYRDGSSRPPLVSREVRIQNFLPLWARVVGLFLMSATIFTCLVSLVGLWFWRERPFVRAGQPIFLATLCIASIVVASTIFTLSFDEGANWNDQALDTACTLTPWLFFIGMNTSCACLAVKLMRIKKITEFRRQKVQARHVIWPMIVLVFSTVVCLLLWTVLEPWSWERDLISENPPESYGQCASQHFTTFFVSLSGIMIVGTALALMYAWQTSNLKMDDKFDDSKAVGLAIASQLQAWLMGLPILVVVEESSVEATYLCRVLLIWIFSMTTVSIVVVPKLINTLRAIRDPSLLKKRGAVIVSGLQVQNTDSFRTAGNSFRKSGNPVTCGSSMETPEAALEGLESRESPVAARQTLAGINSLESPEFVSETSATIKSLGGGTLSCFPYESGSLIGFKHEVKQSRQDAKELVDMDTATA